VGKQKTHRLLSGGFDKIWCFRITKVLHPNRCRGARKFGFRPRATTSCGPRKRRRRAVSDTSVEASCSFPCREHTTFRAAVKAYSGAGTRWGSSRHSHPVAAGIPACRRGRHPAARTGARMVQDPNFAGQDARLYGRQDARRHGGRRVISFPFQWSDHGGRPAGGWSPRTIPGRRGRIYWSARPHRGGG
jgi:hypothetical protein